MQPLTAPKSRAKRLSDAISPIWFVPLLALLIGIWMVVHAVMQTGPIITLSIQSAEGIQAGTEIRARSVKVGEVNRVELSDDAHSVFIKARLNPEYEHLLGQNARFWVVKPRIGPEGISGLSTVLSGTYIELLPDMTEDEPIKEFSVLDQPPIALADANGLRIGLDSDNASSLSVGDPVIFKGYTVGRVESSTFDPKERKINYDIYIFHEYRDLITQNTHFWLTSGVNFTLTSEGFKAGIGSLETLVSGGVTFEVTDGVDPGPTVTENTRFRLYNDEDDAKQGSYNQYIEYVVMVDDSVRGLIEGAPVEYHGLRVGTVTALPWHIKSLSENNQQGFRIPVLIRIEPQRLQPVVTDEDLNNTRLRLEAMVKHGLRASLVTGNMLTGALFVDLSFVDKPAPYQPQQYDGKQVFPSQPGGFSQITGKVSTLLDNLNSLQLGTVVTNLNSTLKNTGDMTEQLTRTVKGLNDAMASPEFKQLPADIQQSIRSLRNTMDGFSQQSPTYRELQSTVTQLNQLLRNAQPAVRKISDKPNALLFNGDNVNDPQPKAHP